MKGKPPIETIRDDDLKASIWENEGKKGKYFTTTFAKTYQDKKTENLRDTDAFNNSDLLKVSELARQAYSRTNELRKELKQERQQEQHQSQSTEDQKSLIKQRLQKKRQNRDLDQGRER